MLILHAFVLFYVSFDFVCSRLLSQCRKCRCRRRPLELQPLDARDTSLDGLDSVVGRSLDEVQIDLGDIAAEAPLGKRDRGEIWPRGIFLHCSWFLLHIYIYIHVRVYMYLVHLVCHYMILFLMYIIYLNITS